MIIRGYQTRIQIQIHTEAVSDSRCKSNGLLAVNNKICGNKTSDLHLRTGLTKYETGFRFVHQID